MTRPTNPSQLVEWHANLVYSMEQEKMLGVLHPDATLLWICADTCDLIAAAMESLPDDTMLSPTFLPFPHGFAFFEKQLDAPAGVPAWQFDAISWTSSRNRELLTALGRPSALPPEHPVVHDPEGSIGLAVATFTDELQGWMPQGFSSWCWGETLDEADGAPEAEREVVILDKRLIAAVALLSSQEGLVDNEDVEPGRAVRRRMMHTNRRVPPIRIIRLRSTGHTSPSDPTGRHYTKRFMVRGHWRQQPYGPGASLRRPIWIGAHIKGPGDAPLDIRPTVHVLDVAEEVLRS